MESEFCCFSFGAISQDPYFCKKNPPGSARLLDLAVCPWFPDMPEITFFKTLIVTSVHQTANQ